MFNSIKKYGFWSGLEYLLNPLGILILSPIYINNLGIKNYGIWIILITTSIILLSIQSSISTEMGLYRSKINRNNSGEERNLLARIKLLLYVAILLGIINSILVYKLVYQNYDGNFTLLIIFTSLYTVMEALDIAMSCLMKGDLSYKKSAKIESIGRFFQIILMTVFLTLIKSLIIVFLVNIIMIIIKLHFRIKDYPGLLEKSLKINLNLREFDFDKNIIYAVIMGLIGISYTTVDKFIINATYSTDFLSIYNLGTQLTSQFVAVSGAILSTLVYTTSSNVNSLKFYNYILNIKYIITFILSIIIGLIIFYKSSYYIYWFWVGESLSQEIQEIILPIIVVTFFQLLVIPGHYILLGKGDFTLVAMLGGVASISSLVLFKVTSEYMTPSYSIYSRGLYGIILLYYYYHLYQKIKNEYKVWN